MALNAGCGGNGLPHGSFEAMVEDDLPFKPSTAQRLMKIADDRRLANPAHAQLLPPSWTTLYELTKLVDGSRGFAEGSSTNVTRRRSDG